MSAIIIGTRGSDLALWQARHVQSELAKHQIASEIKIIETKGDKIQHLSFDKMEGKGFFTKEIEDALLSAEIDLAVHSLKDLPTSGVEGLRLSALTYREDPSDCILARRECIEPGKIFSLQEGAVFGTSSARRKAQMLFFRPDLQIQDLRGNVPTRVQKLRDGKYDAIMLASAGLKRIALDLSDLHVQELSPREFVPAPAQGVVALQIRREDSILHEQLQNIHHSDVAARTNIERKTLRLFDGGCQMPLGVYCEQDAFGQYRVWAALAEAWNKPLRKLYKASLVAKGLPVQVFEELKQADFARLED